MSPLALLLVLLAALCHSAWNLIVKTDARRLELQSGALVVGTLTCAYGAGDMSLVYPVARGSGTVLVAPLAVLLLGERLSPQGVVGIGLVVAGIFLSHGLGRGALGGWAVAGAHRRALGWALLTGALIAGY